MDFCEKCQTNTLSRPRPVKRVMVCTICGETKGPMVAAPLQAVEAIVRPPCEAIINVSTDEWVMMAKNSGAWLYTEGLIGCVGLVVESADRIALAHVLDRNHPATNDKAAAAHQLNLIAAVLGRANIQMVTLIVNSIDRSTVPDTPTYKLVRDWARQCGVDDRNVDPQPGANCVLVCPEEGERGTKPGRRVEDDERRLLRTPATGVRWITNWGKLPQWGGHTGL